MQGGAEAQASSQSVGGRRLIPVLFASTLATAAAIYLLRIGKGSLAANETYSAWAAAMPGMGAILAIPTHVDPGRELIYYIALHYYSLLFGLGPTAIRTLSTIFALVSIGLVFALAREMFDDWSALGASALWAFNPVTYIMAERARTYTLFAAVALAQFLMLWRVRKRPTRGRVAGCGVLGGLMLYTHLAGVVLVATEFGMLARDWLRGRRAAAPWIAIGIALVLFAPFTPVFLSLSDTLVYGHWLDWIGTPVHYSNTVKALALGLALCLGLWFLVSRNREDDELEPVRWCAALALLPFAAFYTGSIVLRPLIHPRYLMPCFAMLAILLAGGLAHLSPRFRNLAVVALVGIFLSLLPLEASKAQPWAQVAAQVASAAEASQPVFFEAGFISPEAIPNSGFPQGYYTVPFNYYFHGPNPRVLVPAYDAEAARAKIAQEVASAGGGWLVSWKTPRYAREELPDSSRFHSQLVAHGAMVTVYRITQSQP
jgi:mannosyltransferase